MSPAESPGEARDGVPTQIPVRPTDAPSAADAAPRLRPFALLGSELGTLFRRRRTIAMLVALAAIPVLIAIVVRITGAGSRGRGPAFLGSITDNGLFVAFTALVVCIPLFLPLTLGVVAGDTVAGEAGLGTLRYLLIAPAGRIRILAVKYAGVVVFSAAATAAIVLAGIGIGAILFPIGPVTLLSGDTTDAVGFVTRTALLAGYVAISLTGLGAIGLFISTLTTVPVGAMAATVVLAGASQIMDQLPQLDWLHPWLFTHYWLGFADLLRDPIVWDSYGQNAVLQLGYVVVFGALAYGRFATKDILS
ncbi:ABC transporter permease [Planctomonas sp. JC2975]|uniref:ABC transporter permease n=1 Tax=Planctomonas sp. JC2975 TaxID=2729626 RepID=UPI00147603E5|nr:ABC transporter permease [Planctomonas sp. JC2975]NNC11494.1 ABC transporter permease [Planctomonas sp. JC2975]